MFKEIFMEKHYKDTWISNKSHIISNVAWQYPHLNSPDQILEAKEDQSWLELGQETTKEVNDCYAKVGHLWMALALKILRGVKSRLRLDGKKAWLCT